MAKKKGRREVDFSGAGILPAVLKLHFLLWRLTCFLVGRFCFDGRELVVFAKQNRRGQHGGPKPALVSHGRLRDVHRANDLIRNAVNLFFLVP
jgi:hypothetical protein